MSAARVIQQSVIASAQHYCRCGSSLEAELDEDGVMLLREFQLMHRSCLGLTDYSEEYYEVDSDASEADD